MKIAIRVFSIVIFGLGLVSLGLMGAGNMGCGTGQVRFADIASGGDDGGGDGGGGGGGGGGGDGGSVVKYLSVNGVYPPSNARGVVLSTSATLTFDIPMDPATITSNTIKVIMVGGITANLAVPFKMVTGLSLDVSDGFSLTGIVTYDEDTNTATFTKDGEFRDCMNYQIIAESGESGAKGAAGEILAEDYVSPFRSSCPEVVTFEGHADSVDVANAVVVTSDSKMYVGGNSSINSFYIYSSFVQQWDVLEGIGDPAWSEFYEQPGVVHMPQSDDLLPFIGGFVYDATAQRLYIGGASDPDAGDADEDIDVYHWFNALDPSAAELLGPELDGVYLTGTAHPRGACSGIARSPTTGRFLMACVEHDESGMTETSYLYSLDETGAIKAYGEYQNPDPLWPGNMLFRAIAFDDEGNAYVTLAPYYLADLSAEDAIMVLKFSAAALIDRDDPLLDPIGAPTVIATYDKTNSCGFDIALAKEGGANVFYVAGTYLAGGDQENDAALVKFGSNGSKVWEALHAGQGSAANNNADDAFMALAVEDGYVYVTGYEGGDFINSFRNMISGKFKDNGSSVEETFFKSYYASPGIGADNMSEGRDIFIDTNAMNEIYIAGYIKETAFNTGTNPAVWRSDNNGVGTRYCAQEANFGPECSPEDFCDDGKDNDGDGVTDEFDADCVGQLDICAVGCKWPMVEDIICDEACNVAACKFDHDACGYCYEEGLDFCPWDWPGDGACDDICNNAACGFDDGDCVPCAPGCESALLGDGNCDSVCNSEACVYDLGDCCLAAGCDISYIGDGSCNIICNIEVCYFDGGDCAACETAGCDLDLIGDENCDEVCNIEECSLDGGDCVVPAEICTGGVDEDGDGDIDCADTDCQLECGIELMCSDMEDNDGDSFVDCADGDCVLAPCEHPETSCLDGIDNDGDGDLDCSDSDCDLSGECHELLCSDNLDNEGDGFVDCSDVLDCPSQDPGDPCYDTCATTYSCAETEDYILSTYGITCDQFTGGCCEAARGRAMDCIDGCCELSAVCAANMHTCNGAWDMCNVLEPGDPSCRSRWIPEYNPVDDPTYDPCYDYGSGPYHCDEVSGCCVPN